jgi:hypothetical protein
VNSYLSLVIAIAYLLHPASFGELLERCIGVWLHEADGVSQLPLRNAVLLPQMPKKWPASDRTSLGLDPLLQCARKNPVAIAKKIGNAV